MAQGGCVTGAQRPCDPWRCGRVPCQGQKVCKDRRRATADGEAGYVSYLASLKEDTNRLILTPLGDTRNLVTERGLRTDPDQNPLRGLGTDLRTSGRRHLSIVFEQLSVYFIAYCFHFV